MEGAKRKSGASMKTPLMLVLFQLMHIAFIVQLTQY